MAVGVTLIALGISLISIGWHGWTFAQFWSSITSGALPGKGH